MSGKVYTRGGDAGQTSLLGGLRVDKDDARIEVYGTMDEGTSMLGMARATTQFDDLCRHIIDIQGELIPIMAEAAFVKGKKDLKYEVPQVKPEQVTRLEGIIDFYNQEWIQTGQFVRPGGSQAWSGHRIGHRASQRSWTRRVSARDRMRSGAVERVFRWRSRRGSAARTARQRDSAGERYAR